MPGIRAYGALALAVCALALTACGGGDEGTIPQEPGAKLLAQLEAIDDAVANGQCDAAAATAVELADTVNQLPEDVDSEVRKGLVEASANLTVLTTDPSKCETPELGPTGPTEPTTTAPTTTAPTTTSTTETTTDEEPPPEHGSGDGPPEEPQGGGKGNPGGGGSAEEDLGNGGIGSGE